MTTTTATIVGLETSCVHDICRQFSTPLFEQMDSGRYDKVSLMPIPRSMEQWGAEHKTARKRSERCLRRGYSFKTIRRHEYTDDINEINMSAPHRQGRPMSQGYMQPQTFSPLPDYPCHRHAVRTYGVLAPDQHLVAYLWLYRAGDLALVSQILGHADHLYNEIMYPLWSGMMFAESLIDADGVIVYNRHDSGTEGLRFFKERVGLEETVVEWAP